MSRRPELCRSCLEQNTIGKCQDGGHHRLKHHVIYCICNVAERAVCKQMHAECIRSHLHISGAERGIKRQGREEERKREREEN